MMKQQTVFRLCGTGAILLTGLLVSRAQEVQPAPILEGTAADVVQHAESSFFAHRDKFTPVELNSSSSSGQAANYKRSALTAQVVKILSAGPNANRDKSFQNPD